MQNRSWFYEGTEDAFNRINSCLETLKEPKISDEIKISIENFQKKISDFYQPDKSARVDPSSRASSEVSELIQNANKLRQDLPPTQKEVDQPIQHILISLKLTENALLALDSDVKAEHFLRQQMAWFACQSMVTYTENLLKSTKNIATQKLITEVYELLNNFYHFIINSPFPTSLADYQAQIKTANVIVPTYNLEDTLNLIQSAFPESEKNALNALRREYESILSQAKLLDPVVYGRPSNTTELERVSAPAMKAATAPITMFSSVSVRSRNDDSKDEVKPSHSRGFTS